MSNPISLTQLREIATIINQDLSIIEEFINNFNDLTDRDFRNLLAALASLNHIGSSSIKPVKSLRDKTTKSLHKLLAAQKLASLSNSDEDS